MVAKIKQGLKSIFSALLSVDRHERLKLFYLTAIYFFVIAGYTVSRELKYSIFATIIGKDFLPHVRILSMFSLIIPLFIYAKMVDSLRRYQVLCACCAFFGFGGLLFTYLLGHPTIGMVNTNASWTRIFGWLFYLFVECYVPFLVSVFWAFANSITDQEAAKKNYGLMVAGSKIGGMIGALVSIAVLTYSSAALSLHVRDVFNHQALLAIASVMCLVAGVFVILLMRYVPGRDLHGYEAAYKLEKERSKKGVSETGFFSGIALLINVPYAFGIFGIVFFYEVINTILSFQRVYTAQAGAGSVSDMSIFLYKTALLMHCIGFIISLFGTRSLVELLGVRRALMLVPAVYGVLLSYYIIIDTKFAFVVVSTVTQAMHYAFSYPLRESLYIPTVKEIKFKSKSWIDSFGSRFGRASSSVITIAIGCISASFVFPALYVIVTGSWLAVASLLGKRYETAVARNEVIGAAELGAADQLPVTDTSFKG